jgi:hypothetical protein
MDYGKLFSVAAVMSIAMAPLAQAQTPNDQGGASYPASMAGVDMASIPVGDICQLNNNPGLTADGQALVADEIANRPVTCPVAGLGLGSGLTATNAGLIIPVATTLLLVAVAGGGGTNGTNGTQ